MYSFLPIFNEYYTQIGHVIVSRHLFPPKSYYLCIVFIKNGKNEYYMKIGHINVLIFTHF